MADGEGLADLRLLLQAMDEEARGPCQRLRGRESLKQPKLVGPRPRRLAELDYKTIEMFWNYRRERAE